MTWHNILCILTGLKIATLRPVSGSPFRVGSTQLVKVAMFSSYYYLKIEITSRDLVNLNELQPEDFHELGYISKDDYLNEPFNKKNPNPERFRYYFKVTEVQPDLLTGILEVLS